MAKHPEDGFARSRADQSNFPPNDDYSVESPLDEEELATKEGRLLPALAPQHNASDEVKGSTQEGHPSGVPAGEVSVICNLEAIEAYAARHPAAAAKHCGEAIEKLNSGYRRAKRLCLAATYLIAFNLKHNEEHLEFFTFVYHSDATPMKNEDIEEVRGKLMYKTGEYIYYFYGGATKNRAYCYAHGLDYFLRANVEPSEVKSLILKHGPEKLYRAALERNALEKIKASYETSGRSIDKPVDQNYVLAVASGKEWEETIEAPK